MHSPNRKNQRRTIRLPGYDYSSPGAYFVTMCTWRRRPLFGTLGATGIHLTALGDVVAQQWSAIPRRFAGVSLDAFVIMPDHIHGVIWLPGSNSKPVVLSSVIRYFKIVVTQSAREMGVARVWQRNYYEHVVRDSRDLDRIRRYINANPARAIRALQSIGAHLMRPRR